MKITKKDWVTQIQAQPNLCLVQNLRGEVNPPEPRIVVRVTGQCIVFKRSDGRESEMPFAKGASYYRDSTHYTVTSSINVVLAKYRID